MGVDRSKTMAKGPSKKSSHRRSSSSSSDSSNSSSDSGSSGSASSSRSSNSSSSSSSSSTTTNSSSSSSSGSEANRHETRHQTAKERHRTDAVDNRDRRTMTKRKDHDDDSMTSSTRKRILTPHSPDEAPPDLEPRSPRSPPPTNPRSPVQDKGSTRPSHRSPIKHPDMETGSTGKRSEDELSIGPDDKDMYEDEEMSTDQEQKKKSSRPQAYSDSEEVNSDSDDSYSWRTERVKSVLQSRVHKPEEKRQRHRSASYERENFDTGGRFRSVVGTTIKRPSRTASPESGEITDSDEEKHSRRTADRDGGGEKEKDTEKTERGSSDRHRSRRLEDGSRTHDKDPDRYGQRDRGAPHQNKEDEYQEAERNFRKRRFERAQDERPRQERDKNLYERDLRRQDRDDGPSQKKQPEDDQPAVKRKKKESIETPLQSKTGGAYIPPAKLKMMQAMIADKSSLAYQRLAWEALKKSINGLINKTNVSNIGNIIQELLQLNIVRGRGLLSRSIIQAQTASPTFTHVFAGMVAVINCKFPQNGELILKRLIINFKKGFRRNDKVLCLASTRFIAHLVNQQVAHEVIALEVLTLLLENPTDDSVEISVGFLKESGLKLSEITPRGINAIFDRLRGILHEAQIEQRVQYMVEVIFANRKDGFKDFPAVQEGLDLVEEAEQYTHLLTLEDNYEPEDLLNIFQLDADYIANEERYKAIRKEILGEDSDESGSDNGSDDESDSQDGDSDDEEKQAAKMEIIDQTETNMIALRRTIYLTIQSSLDFEECAHKMLRMQFKPGQEKEVCLMILDCCAQQRTYEKFFGLLAQRFCQLKREYVQQFEMIFPEQYETCHRLDTNKLRNVAKFFSHLLHTDAVSWTVLSAIKMNEDDTTSSSRIFVKIMFQELSEYMGLTKMNERLRDRTLQPYFEGLMPRDNPANTRFSINFFTTIGLGGLTDDLREHLKNYQRVIMQQQRTVQSDSSSSSDSSSDSSSESSDSSDSSDASDSTDSSDSSDSSSSESEEDTRHKEKSRIRKRDGNIVRRKEKYTEERSAEQSERHDKRHNEIRHRNAAKDQQDYALDGQRDRRFEVGQADRRSDRPNDKQKSNQTRERDDHVTDDDYDKRSNEHRDERNVDDRDRSNNGRQEKRRDKHRDENQDRHYEKSPPRPDRKSARDPRSYNRDAESDNIRTDKSRNQRSDGRYVMEDKENKQQRDGRDRRERPSRNRSDDWEDELFEKRDRSRKERDYDRSYSKETSNRESTSGRSRRREYSDSPDDGVRREHVRERR